VQKLLYLGVISPASSSFCRARDLEAGAAAGVDRLFGGYDAARYVHFFAMAAIVGFFVFM
jgi:thiosulfate reductase cytochrome b subunit